MHTSLADQSSLPDATPKVQQGNTIVSAGKTADGRVDASRVLTSAEPVSIEDRLETQAQSKLAAQSGGRSTSASQELSTETTNVDYPPEIAEMIENRVDRDLQARYENDEREDSWAPYMEGLLTDYFAQKPALAQFYFSLIDCRTSVCEIHVLGYGTDALTQWNSATADIVSQPWFEFNNMSMNRRNPEPDILAIVLILTKRPPD